MKQESRIVVTGARGMVGQALLADLARQGYRNVVALTRAECDLESTPSVAHTFEWLKPEYVFHLAAKVGGIGANVADPVGFMLANLKMALNVFETCWRLGVKRTLFMGSSCVYPRECLQPIKESYLLSGPLEPTNEAYAIAKIAGLKLAEYLNRQHGLSTVCPMASNIYGLNDSFDLQNSHVLSALVRRFCDAVDENQPSVTLWGSGAASREFTNVKDIAAGCRYLMAHPTPPQLVNLGSGEEVTIRQLAELIAAKTGFGGEIIWDTSKPEGMPRKCMDTTLIRELGFACGVRLNEGVDEMVRHYRDVRPLWTARHEE